MCMCVIKNKKELTTTTNTQTSSLSPSSSSSSIQCVSPNVVTGSKNKFVVFEAIYYDNSNTNQFVLAKVKNAQMDTTTKLDPQTPMTSVGPATPITTTTTTVATTNGGVVKKPGIILLTQASLSKLLNSSDLNVINNNFNGRNRNNEHDDSTKSIAMNSTMNSIPNNNNTIIIAPSTNNQSNSTNHIDCNNRILTTSNHVHHPHQNEHLNNHFNKCNSQIHNHFNQSQNHNNPYKSVLMINSTSTLETTAGIVTITSTTGTTSAPIKRDENDDQQVRKLFTLDRKAKSDSN